MREQLEQQCGDGHCKVKGAPTSRPPRGTPHPNFRTWAGIATLKEGCPFRKVRGVSGQQLVVRPGKGLRGACEGRRAACNQRRAFEFHRKARLRAATQLLTRLGWGDLNTVLPMCSWGLNPQLKGTVPCSDLPPHTQHLLEPRSTGNSAENPERNRKNLWEARRESRTPTPREPLPPPGGLPLPDGSFREPRLFGFCWGQP